MQGKIINGFELKNRLGMGGMAEVWYAENKIGKKAAVKILLPKYCSDENVTSRFYTEAMIMVKMNHPNIRQVYDYGEIDNRPVIVMEYLDGEDLKERLKQGQCFTEAQLEKWWNQLVAALNYTHGKGITHRDIKPGNIFVDNDGNIKLLDFGIAKVRESISSTQTGQKLGTLMYMSPEQVKDSKHIDYRTDVYSLAVTFVHLLTGKKPYDSDTTSDFEISEQIVYKPVDLSELPEKWSKFLQTYLEKDPNARPALEPFITNKTDDDDTIVDGSPTPDKGPVPDNKKTSNKTGLYIIIGVIVACIGLGLFYKYISSQKDASYTAYIENNITNYLNTVNSCDQEMNNMVKGRDGIEANGLVIIRAFEKLKEIELYEKTNKYFNDKGYTINNYELTTKYFDKTGMTPCYTDKFATFKKNLERCAEILNKKYKYLVKNKLNTDDNPEFIKTDKDLKLTRDLLTLIENGSVMDIDLRPSKTE